MWGEKERWQGSSLGPWAAVPLPRSFSEQVQWDMFHTEGRTRAGVPVTGPFRGKQQKIAVLFHKDVPVASVAGEEGDRTPGWRMLATTIGQPAWAFRSPGLLCSCCQNMKNCFSSYKANCTFAVYIFLVLKPYSKCWHMLCWSFHTNCCTLLCSWWAALSRCCLICYTSAALTARKPARLAAFSYFWGWFRQ